MRRQAGPEAAEDQSTPRLPRSGGKWARLVVGAKKLVRFLAKIKSKM